MKRETLMTRKHRQTWTIRRQLRGLVDEAALSLVPTPPFPSNLMVELSNACNHACIFCANPKMTRTRRRIDSELLGSILVQARKLGTTKVGFYTTGDPFAHTGLEDFIGQAKDLDYEYTYISTNGSLATPERITAAVDAGLDSAKFSINAGSRQTYRLIHGRDDWDTVVANLRFLLAYREKLRRELRVGITYVVTDQNRHECEDFRIRFGPLVDDICFSECGHQSGYMHENGDSVAAECTAIPEKTPCWMLFSRAHVTCEGYLTLCCVDYQNYLAVADLNGVGLKEAWESALFKEMRKRHLRNDVKGTLCWNCIHDGNGPVEPLDPCLATRFAFSTASGENLERQHRRLAEFAGAEAVPSPY